MKPHFAILMLMAACASPAADGQVLRQTGRSDNKAGTAPGPGVREVVVVFKTHFDIGYTDMAKNVVERYRTSMIDQALEVCDRNRDLPPEQQFAWTLPGWPMSQIMADWPGQTAERKARIEQALKEGRFVVHGLPFTTHTCLPSSQHTYWPTPGLAHGARARTSFRR